LISFPDAAAPPHLERCAACARFAAALVRTAAALDREFARADAAALPADLRARILSSSGASVVHGHLRPEPRGRLLDLTLRLAAVAAVGAGIARAWPNALVAAEIDSEVVREWTGRIESALATNGHVVIDTRRLTPSFAPFDVPAVEDAPALGLVSLMLLASGVGLLRKSQGNRRTRADAAAVPSAPVVAPNDDSRTDFDRDGRP
jgi:hypothetical protein